MSRIEDFLVRNTKSAICFMFAFICSFFIAIAIFDYSNNKYVYNNDLSNINYVEGKISSIEQPKTNIDIYVEDIEKEFYIHKKYIEKNINVGDYVIIHYANNSPIRGNHYEIVNLVINGEEVYTLNQFKDGHKPEYDLILLLISSIVVLSLIVIGIALLNKEKPIYDLRKYIEENKEKYNISDKQIEELIKQFEGTPKQGLNKPREEVYEMFKKSIYTKNNRTYTSGLELIETEEYGEIFFEVLSNMVNEKELKVIYDGALSDDSGIYVIYKINNKTAALNLFSEDETNRFNINKDTLYFMFPKDKKPNYKETTLFINEIEKYNMYYENIFDIE